MTTMTGAEVAATRHLLGLTRNDLAGMLRVNPHTVKAWESGSQQARPGVIAELQAIRAKHDQEVRRLIEGARDGVPIEFPDGPKPRGWYLAMGARVLDAVPDAMLDWA